MAHDQEGVEAQRGVDHDLAMRGAQQAGQPARLARVGQQEYRLMALDQGLQLMKVRLCLRSSGAQASSAHSAM